jgi:hypothetical protein
MRTSIRALLAATAVVTALAFAGVAPADATPYPRAYANPSSRGYASFESHGDQFRACDTSADGHSIGMRWWLSAHGNWIPQPTKYNYRGSGTCRTFGESSLLEGAYVRYQACLFDHASPGGKPPAVVGGSCGAQKQGNTWG